MSRILKAEWLPNSFPKQKPSRIVLHWTGGSRRCSDLDRQHYHFIVDGAGTVHQGDHSIKANCRPMSRRYAAHALNFNAGTIGIALCGMAGASEMPLSFGPFPILQAQWLIGAQVAAECCEKYGINPLTRAVCQHGEIQDLWDVKQRGKWDVCRLPWAPHLSPAEVGKMFRLTVSDKLTALK